MAFKGVFLTIMVLVMAATVIGIAEEDQCYNDCLDQCPKGPELLACDLQCQIRCYHIPPSYVKVGCLIRNWKQSFKDGNQVDPSGIYSHSLPVPNFFFLFFPFECCN